eukprot:TRINITY_DN6512_c0_g1_i1.p1 TRINITY_DN6512_c0_g1~~TRINITY_DN6512_c0_g1_i1.p1  ORF type:complete len:295 (-),score=91.58 TRINITY_DN6512_c0_g1_i1:32-916(-)
MCLCKTVKCCCDPRKWFRNAKVTFFSIKSIVALYSYISDVIFLAELITYYKTCRECVDSSCPAYCMVNFMIPFIINVCSFGICTFLLWIPVFIYAAQRGKSKSRWVLFGVGRNPIFILPYMCARPNVVTEQPEIFQRNFQWNILLILFDNIPQWVASYILLKELNYDKNAIAINNLSGSSAAIFFELIALMMAIRGYFNEKEERKKQAEKDAKKEAKREAKEAKKAGQSQEMKKIDYGAEDSGDKDKVHSIEVREDTSPAASPSSSSRSSKKGGTSPKKEKGKKDEDSGCCSCC